jgi:MFS family permease
VEPAAMVDHSAGWRYPVPLRLMRRARLAVAGAYLVQGLCFAAVLTQVATLKAKFGFSDGELTLILLAVPVVAGAGSLLAGVIAPRLGSRIVLRLAGLGVCAAMVCVALAASRTLLYLSVSLFGLVLGAVDATMNMQGVAVQRWYGRSILASFHGVWSLAGFAAALAMAAADRLDVPLLGALGAAAVVGALIALTVGPFLLSRQQERAADAATGTGDRSEHGRGGVPVEPPVPVESRLDARIPWRPILLIGVAVMVMYIADSATSNWSAVYLRDELHGGKGIPALGLAAYLICQIVGRGLADRVVRRFGPVRTVAVGGLVGGLGLAVVALAPAPWVGIAGFGVVGVGLCVVVPQSFTAAGALDPAGSGVAIARVNLFNYVGFVAGAALIGAVAEAANRRWAFAVPAVLALAIVALARAFRSVPASVGAAAPGG